MSNVVDIASATRPAVAQDQLTALARAVVCGRRDLDDVFWLKENAEFLSALVATGTSLPPAARDLYRPVYDALAKRLQFFPQYYRFFLSIALDLEHLGMPGDMASRLCATVAHKDLVTAELSDLQRAEAAALLAQRGHSLPEAAALQLRLLAFAGRADIFALPNRKAAYELTHILFYLSDHGRRPVSVDPEVIRALHYAGLIGWLEQNCDLLAEICIALRYAGAEVPVAWQTWLASLGARARVISGAQSGDDYHAWLMTLWAQAVLTGQPLAPRGLAAQGAVCFAMPQTPGVLRRLSAELMRLGTLRRADWMQMRPLLCRVLSPQEQAILTVAEAAPVGFDGFFARFARASSGLV